MRHKGEDYQDSPVQVLAMLLGPDQPWLTTEEFLGALDENLAAALA
jgi:hypothetical protein